MGMVVVVIEVVEVVVVEVVIVLCGSFSCTAVQTSEAVKFSKSNILPRQTPGTLD